MQNNCFAVRLVVGGLVAVLMAWMPLSVQAQSAAKAQAGLSEARLARVFQDNAVLQREKPVPVWGWAKPGATVEVSFGGQKKTATADAQGYWKAILDPMKANREGQVLTAQVGDKALTCKNVLVGEVWLSAGPSGTTAEGPNVDTGVYPRYVSTGTKGGKPEVRFFSVYNGVSMEPYKDFDPLIQGEARWNVLHEEAGPDSDAVMRSSIQYFARILRDKLDVPVGIFHMVTLGVLEPPWMPRETLEAIPADNGPGNGYQELFNASEARFAKNPLKSWAGFKKAEDEWRVTRQGAWPPGRDPITLFGYPTVGYNTRICPLAPYALRGVRLFAPPVPGCGGAAGLVALVKQWRKLFGQDFYFINCTNIRMRTTGQQPLKPAMIFFDPDTNEVYKSLKLFGPDKREELVEFTDLSGWQAHHCERAEEGRRLAMTALSLAYGQKLPADGACPRLAETKIQDNKAIVRFEQVGEGMVYQPSIDGISGVYLRGKTGTGRWAQVKILGKDTVEFSNSEITDLSMIAYGQYFNAHETLFNSANLPASPFIVNPVPWPHDPPSPFSLLKFITDTKKPENAALKNAQVSLAHVRRTGYVYQIVGAEVIGNDTKQIKGLSNEKLENSSATISIQAYIPAEWKGYEVVTGDKCDLPWINGSPVFKGIVKTGGKSLKTEETTKDGARFVTFNSPVDGTWVIIAEKGKAADFRKINRY